MILFLQRQKETPAAARIFRMVIIINYFLTDYSVHERLVHQRRSFVEKQLDHQKKVIEKDKEEIKKRKTNENIKEKTRN